jgi:hypothetical protein
MKKVLILLFCSLAFVQCKNASNESSEEQNTASQQEEIYKQVIALHDEAMPKLGSVADLMQKIEAKIGELEQSKSDTIMLTTLREELIALNDADEAMMNWMRSFEANYDGWEEDSVIAYLQDQKLKMFEINQEITTAIDQANLLIE